MWFCLVSTPVTPVTVNVPLFENGSSISSVFSNKWNILSKFFLTLPIADLCWEEIPKIQKQTEDEVELKSLFYFEKCNVLNAKNQSFLRCS